MANAAKLGAFTLCMHKYDRYENGVRLCLKCGHQISVNPEDRDE